MKTRLVLAPLGALILLSGLTVSCLPAPSRIEVVSVDSSGNPGDGNSTSPSISADGHYVAFESCVTDKGSKDNSCRSHVFVTTLPR
jgi:hypothetical protein